MLTAYQSLQGSKAATDTDVAGPPTLVPSEDAPRCHHSKVKDCDVVFGGGRDVLNTSKKGIY